MLPFRMSEMIRGLPGFLLASQGEKNATLKKIMQLPICGVFIKLATELLVKVYNPLLVRCNEVYCPINDEYCWPTPPPAVCLTQRSLTADGDSQLHSSPLG